MTTFKNDFQVSNIPLDSALVDFPINLHGYGILILSSPVNLTVKLHNINNTAVPLRNLGYMLDKGGFDRFYITCSALAGATLQLGISTDPNITVSTSGGVSADDSAPTTLGEDAVVCTLAATEYSQALTDGTKGLILKNTSIDAIFYVSFLALNSANGIIVLPLSQVEIKPVNINSYTMYIQSDVAARTLNFVELL